MELWFLKGQVSRNRTRRSSCKSPIRARLIFRRSRPSVSESAVCEEVQRMKSDDTTRRIEPAEDRDDNIHVEHEVETEAAEVHEPQPSGTNVRRLSSRRAKMSVQSNPPGTKMRCCLATTWTKRPGFGRMKCA